MNTFHTDIRRSQTGFTLIELLVVIALLTVLPALLLPAIQRVREAAAHMKCSASLNQLIIASQEYRNRSGSYPRSLDDLIGWNFTPLDPQVAQGKKDGYLYEVVESAEDHCRFEAKPEVPGITASLTMGAVVTWNNARSYQILTAGANEAKEEMLLNIRAKAVETVVRLLSFDNSATSQVRGYVVSSDTLNGIFDTLDGDDDGWVTAREILSSSSTIPDAELRGPVEEFLAYVAREMRLDSLSDDSKRSIAVSRADLERGPVYILDTKDSYAQVASASAQNEVVLLFSSSPIRITRAETLRMSIGREMELDAAVEVRASAQLFDVQGNLGAQSAEVEIPPRGFRTIDFNGDALLPSASQGVGQHEIVGAIVKVHVVQAAERSRQITNDIVFSLELFDNLTGKTQIHMNSSRCY